MLRSFVKCDDPKGVVECGKIRKYRTCSQKRKDMIKIQKPTENADTSLINKRCKEEMVPKLSIEKSFVPSSLLLEQVSGEDQSSNMIDSRSSVPMYQERRSADIAKNLLKGALDLQDSLVFLTKMQEASQDISFFKMEQPEKPKRDTTETNMIGTTCSNQFSARSDYPMGFHRPHLSDDCSPSNCKEELKKVIKESLVVQNLFSSTTVERLDSVSDTTSTSLSRSPAVKADKLSDPSNSLTVSKTEGRLNLVAKLMGLEEAPSTSFPTVMQKQLDGEKIQNQKRPIFEIDMLKVRMNSSTIEKVNSERKTLREKPLETMHFKGLLKKKSFVKEHKLRVHHSKQFDGLSHVALAKPHCTPYQESVRPHGPFPSEELSLRKLKAEAVSSKTIKLTKGSGSTNMGNEMEKGVSKRVTKEDRPKFIKEVVKADAKGINPNEHEKLSGKVKLDCHVSHVSQVNETSDKKYKVQTISRKLAQYDVSDSESRIVASHQSKPQMKKQSHVAEHEAAKPIVEQIGQGEEKSIDVPCKCDYTEQIRVLADKLLVWCEADAFTNKIREKYKWSKCTSSDDIMLLKFKHENGSIHAEIDAADVKHFLLTSQSFISHIEKLFNLDYDCPMTLQKHEINEINVNLRLYLDCANQLAELKSLQESQVVRSFSQNCAGNSRLHISLGKLVEEIYNAIENLKFHSENYGEKYFLDNILAIVEKDIKCNGIWEWGWNQGFSADEVDLVVNEVESMLLSGLIEEVII